MEMINGYACKTCTDVEYAKKYIDPAHPKDGPFREKRVDKPAAEADRFGAAVQIDGRPGQVQPDAPAGKAINPLGGVVDLRA